MSKFLEIGEIIEIMPDAFGVINLLKEEPIPESKNNSSNSFTWIMVGLIVVGTGYAIYRINKKRNESINISNKS